MIAKIVAILVSEGTSVEGTKVEAEEQSHEISTSCNFGLCLLVLICIGLCCMFIMFVSAAVWDQALRFGKEKKRRKRLKRLEKEKREEKMMNEEEKKIEEGQKEEVEEIPQMMRDIAPPSEPAPTSSGPGTMENRAGELRTMMLDAKAGSIAAVERENEKEAGKENPTVPDTLDVGKSKESGVEEEDEESPESSDTSEEEAEKENPTVPVPQTSATNIEQVATPEESPEERKERLCRELDEGFRKKMKHLTNEVEKGLAFSATRAVTALFHGSVSALHTPSDIAAEDVKEFQTLGEINRETLTTLEKTKRRSEQFRLLLKAKESHLTAQKTQLDQELTKKINWIQNRLREEQVEDGAIERMVNFHETVEEYAVEGMKSLKETQNTPQAQEIGWAGLQFDLTREGCDQLGNLSLCEAIFAERIGLTEKNPVQDLELALKELESAPMIDLEREGSTAPSTGEGSMAPPKDPTVPKPKKAPAGMTPATKAMPKIQDDKKEKEAAQETEKKKREEDAAAIAEAEKGGKKARYEYQDTSVASLVKSKYVPKEHLYVSVPGNQ